MQGGVFEELVQHLARLSVALQFNDDRDAVAVRRIAQVGDVVDDALGHQFGHTLDEHGLVDLVGQLGDVDLHPVGMARVWLDIGHAAHDHTAAAGGVGVANALVTDDDAAGGEVGAFDELHQFVEGHIVDIILTVDQVGDGVAQLTQVVGRDVGGHADGDARRAVEQQIGQSRRQQARLFQRIVEIGREIDGVLVEVFQQFHGDGCQAGLGITHGCRAVAVDAAEVALAVDQHVAHGELLGHTHHRVIDGAVTVRVVFAQHLADDTGALAVGGIRPQAHVIHGIEDAAVHRLQPVAGIGQRPRDDHAHGVIKIGAAHLLVNVNAVDCSCFQLKPPPAPVHFMPFAPHNRTTMMLNQTVA